MHIVTSFSRIEDINFHTILSIKIDSIFFSIVQLQIIDVT